MRAIGYRASLPATHEQSLIDLELPEPVPHPRDLLVSVHAVSVNPVDVKQRMRTVPPAGHVRVLGFDAAGIVQAVGTAVSLFAPGDEVYYAGAIDRPGSNSELQLVDERIVGHKPRTLSFAEAAALPLTTLAAWELLFDRLGIERNEAPLGTLLVINGAGGVGSILNQIARRLTGLTVVATASRPESRAWCMEMGAHFVINHRRPLGGELKSIGIPKVEYIAGLAATEEYVPAMIAAIAPQGKIALIDDPKALDIVPLKSMSVSVHWESMFTRSLFHTADMIAQHAVLDEVAELVDAGVLRTTLTMDAGEISAANLRRVHAIIESGTSIGKIVLSGFGGHSSRSASTTD